MTPAESTGLPGETLAVPDVHLTYLIAKAAHVLERTLDGALAGHGLTLRQFSALVHIDRVPGLSGADLARLLLTSPQAANTLVQRLLAAGLIERPDGPQRQPRPLALTSAGRRAIRSAAATATTAERVALSAVDPGDLDAIHRAMRTLVAPPPGDHPPD